MPTELQTYSGHRRLNCNLPGSVFFDDGAIHPRIRGGSFVRDVFPAESWGEIVDDAVTRHAGLVGANIEHEHVLQRVQGSFVQILGPEEFFHDGQGGEVEGRVVENDVVGEDVAESGVVLVIEEKTIGRVELFYFNDGLDVGDVRGERSRWNTRRKASACKEREGRNTKE